MADNLMDFTEEENKENVSVEYSNENTPLCAAPSLVQSPVVVNSILKQCTKDNLIQLYTPVQKPVKGKLKVRFGPDRLLETPQVKGDQGQARVQKDTQQEDKTNTGQRAQLVVGDEEEEWVERTSVLTKQDHEEYTTMAADILQELVTDLPISREPESSQVEQEPTTVEAEPTPIEPKASPVEPDKGPVDPDSNQVEAEPSPVETDGDVSMMDVSEYEPQAGSETPAPEKTGGSELSALEKLLLEAQMYLQTGDVTSASTDTDKSKALQDTSAPVTVTTESCEAEKKSSQTSSEAVSTAADSAEEAMDCEEAMDVDDGEQVAPAVVEVKTAVNALSTAVTENVAVTEVNTAVSEVNTAIAEVKTEADNAGEPPTVKQDKVAFEKPVDTACEAKVTIEEPASEKKAVESMTDVDSAAVKDPVETEKVAKVPLEEQPLNTSKISLEPKAAVLAETVTNFDEIPVGPASKSQVKEDSSDDEFMSADEDVVEQKSEAKAGDTTETRPVTPPSSKEPVSDSPERTPPKVGYSLNFDEMDMMNPFATKKGLTNSPDIGKPDAVKEEKKEQEDNPKLKDLKVKPMKDEKLEEKPTVGEVEKPEIKKKDELEEADNSSSVKSDVSPLKDDSSVSVPEAEPKPAVEVPVSAEADQPESPERIPPKVGYSLNFDDLDMMNPFATKTGIANSPDLKKTTSNNENKVDKTNNKKKESNKEDIDKPKPPEKKEEKTCPTTTHPKKLDEEAALQKADATTGLDTPCADSTADQNKVKAEKQHENNSEEVAPKQPIKKKKEKVIDKTEKSPDPTKGVPNDNFDEQIPVSKGAYNFDDIDFDSIDPFKPKKQMMNSPDMTKVKSEDAQNTDQPVKPTSPESQGNISKQLETDTETRTDDNDENSNNNADNETKEVLPQLEDIDPFKPQKQMQNSPVSSKKPVSQIEIENNDDIDPFKPRNQMCNSPVDKVNSGTVDRTVDDNQEKTEETLDNTLLDNVDPFSTKSKVAKSPAAINKPVAMDAFDDLNPFKTKSTIVNSPDKSKDTTGDSEQKNIGDVNFDAIDDPFKPRKQMSNSPNKDDTLTMSDADPFAVKSKIPESPKTANKLTTVVAESEEAGGDPGDEIFEIQGVARRGDQPSGAAIQNFGDCLDFDEAQFVPATEVFSGPGVWDMLEQFGNKKDSKEESSLSRMSLYVKFDPLVDAAPANPRRISIRPSQLEKVKEYGLDETLLLLGTPPKKRRQSMSQRNTPAEGRSVSRPSCQTSALATAPSAPRGAVDMILEYSPSRETPTSTEEKKEKRVFPPSLSLLSDAEATDSDTNLFQELKYTDSDLRKLRAELQLDLQGQLLAKEATFQKERDAFKQEIRAAKEETKQAHGATKTLEGEVAKMAEVCKMFEGTIKEMAEKNEQANKKVLNMKEERDQALQDLLAVENSFSDLHRRYEKIKNVLSTMMQNEEVLKKTVAEHLEKKKTMDANFAKLKKQAEEKVARYASDLAKLQKQSEEEKSSLMTKNKLLHMQVEGAEKTIQQKIEENKQLTEICEKLIAKSEGDK